MEIYRTMFDLLDQIESEKARGTRLIESIELGNHTDELKLELQDCIKSIYTLQRQLNILRKEAGMKSDIGIRWE